MEEVFSVFITKDEIDSKKGFVRNEEGKVIGWVNFEEFSWKEK